MIDKDGKVYRGLQAQVAYLTEKVENGGGGSTSTGPTVDKITALDLATGEAALTYDANNGATIVKQGQISADGNTFDVAVEDKLPIVPGDNVTIGTTADGKHLKISAVGGGGGGGVAGVSSFGGKTGAINVGKNLSMNGNVVNADFQPTPVVLDPDANLGTLTDNQLATLQANTANPIVKRNEYYYLNDKQFDPGTLVYTHLCYSNGKWYAKSITITISSKAWVKKVLDIPDKTMIPFISLSSAATSYPLNGNFSIESATKLVSSPFSVISFTPPGSAVQVPLLLQPSETIHNSYVYSGNDDSYTYTLNATLSVTSANTWLDKSYVITRKAYVAPVTTTIDGKSGAFTLGDNLNLANSVISATDTVTTVNGHTGAVNIVAGSNVSVDDVGGTLTISATGGGGGGGGTDKGFDNLSALTIAASQYASPHSAAGPFFFKGSGTAQWKDGSTSTSIPVIGIQLGCDPGAGISFRAVGEGAGASCEIGLTDLAVLDLGEFETFPVSMQDLTTEQAELIEQHKFSFIKFRDKKGWNNGAAELDVYCVPVDNAVSHGGLTYKSITTQGNTYTVGISIQRAGGIDNPFAHKRYAITKEATPTPGGGGGGKIYQHNIYTLCDPATQVYWTGYTSDNTPLTSLAAWQAKFGNDKTYGGGYIVYNTNNYYPILYTQADSESIKSYYMSNSMSGSTPTATYEWGGTGNWTDVVKEV